MGEPVFYPRKLIAPNSFLGWLGGDWLNHNRIEQAFERQRQDRLGLAVHLVGGMMACFTISFPYTVHEFILPVVASASLIRITMTWRLLTHLLLQPVVLVGLVWLAFRLFSMLWTSDPGLGWTHLGEARFALLLLALWPIMEYRTVLIGSYLAGMLVGNGVQLAEFIGLQTGLGWLIWERHAPGRITGWWRPAFGGASLCVPLAIWLYAAFLARGQRTGLKRLAIAMSAVSLIAVLASGTRSAWLAAGCTLMVVLAIAALRAMRSDNRGGVLVSPGGRGLITSGAVLGIFAILVLAPMAFDRASNAYTEIRGALAEDDYDSDNGARVLMWIEAARGFSQHPIGGLGEGAYRSWARDDALRIVKPEVAERIRQHAHGTIPHIAATGGVVGLGVFALFISCALRSAWQGPRSGPTGLERSLFLAIIALLMVGQFETMHVGSRLKQHMWLLLALSPAYVPTQRISEQEDER